MSKVWPDPPHVDFVPAVGEMTLGEIASEIHLYLKKFEREHLLTGLDQPGCYYMGGARVRITYISRSGGMTMSRPKAQEYLVHLRNGEVKHHAEVVQTNRFATTAKLDGGQRRRGHG